MDSRLLRIFHHHDNIRDWLRLHGMDAEYGPDLLGWTANQLSWVSQRTEGPLQRELFDRLRPVIDRVFPFDDARAAYHHMRGASHFGKIVVRPER